MSRIALLFCIFVIAAAHFGYYPKWQKQGTEATISWDVSGYYMYLPATFIYKDLKQCKFKDDVLKKYNPTPDFQQAFVHEKSGNYVMKYSLGQAVVFSPFFAIAHLWASYDSQYPPDGFSLPYQLLISLGMLLIAFLGLIYLRKILLTYFDDGVVALSLVAIVLGSNYLNYTAIDGAMTHNSLFTIYILLIYSTIRFYQKPSMAASIAIGICLGLAALIRPTEIIACMIPILWGMDITKASIYDRIAFLRKHIRFLVLAALIAASIGFLQLLYWKYVSGEWVVYSYQDQGFSWLSPHIKEGLFSYKSGWLVYSPLMIFSLLGFIFLFSYRKRLFLVAVSFSCLFIYIAFAWDIWWYGGSLGQRTMVQAYPILAIPLSAFIAKVWNANRTVKVVIAAVAGLFIYANIWFTHQAHKGGLLHVSQMTKPYFWKTLFTYEKNQEDLKLLDNIPEIYEGKLKNTSTIYNDDTYSSTLNKEVQYSEPVILSTDKLPPSYDWLRVSIDASIEQKEWNIWTMTFFVVKLKNHTSVVSQGMYRMQRHMADNQTKRLHLDIRNPNQPITDVEVMFWNANGHKKIKLTKLKVETFDEP